MSIESEKDLVGLFKIGQLVGQTLQKMAVTARAGMTTAELDAIAARELAHKGARSAPQLTYQFPGTACISVNDVVAHGIPGDQVLKEGDLVKLDLSAELEGYFADAALTVGIGNLSPVQRQLIDCAKAAFYKGAAAARAAHPLNAIGRAVQGEVSRQRFSVLEELPGHGVGRALHENPTVPLVYLKNLTQRLTRGLVITIEPHIAAKRTRIYEDSDGWTLRTRNGSIAAAFEHTVVVTQGAPILVTALTNP